MFWPVPSVTVIIPAYNPGPFLERSLGSVLAQSMADLEVIVIDDGGEEDLSWVEQADPRVQLLRQRNAGVSVARNVAAASAASPLLAFLDQDDVWLPEKL